MDADSAKMFSDAADTLFEAMLASFPFSVSEHSLRVQSLVWYAAHTANTTNLAAALAELPKAGEALRAAATPPPVLEVGGRLSTSDRAYAVRGLIEAGRVSGQDTFLDAAVEHLRAMFAAYSSSDGTFALEPTYSIDDVGSILGAISAARLFLGGRIDQQEAGAVFAGFFEAAVNLSGMQISAPPPGLFKAPFEQEEPEIFLRYPKAPTPPTAGGDFGVAPVFAASITWDGEKWIADQSHFDTAGAMHTANEMIWFHADEVNGFPEIEEQEAGGDYVVVAGDTLYTIAARLLVDGTRYPEIVELTNTMSETDTTYARIDNADLILVGWRLAIP
jgi:hypothetical protein